MKKALNSLIQLGIALAIPASAGAQGLIHHFRVNLCSLGGLRCLEIQGTEARQSVLASIYGFKDSEVKWIDHQTGQIKVFSKARGYIDFDSNQIVLIEKSEGQVLERSFSLSDLTETKFITK